MSTPLLTYAAALGSRSVPTWPPQPREPLPPYPMPTADQPNDLYAACWTHDAYSTTLPFTPPSTPTLDFHRGNVCGHRVPGAPPVGGGCKDPSVIFTWFLPYYARDWQERILDSYQACGYTHLNLHRACFTGNLIDEGCPALPKPEALAFIERARARGLYVIVNLAINNGPPDKDEWLSWTPDLISAGMQIGCLAWQADQRFRNPGDWCNYIEWGSPYLKERGVKVAAQYINHSCTWYNAADDPQRPSSCVDYGVCNRFAFMEWTADKIDFPYQQFDVNAPILDTRPHEGGMLGEAVDVMKSLVGQKLVACELRYQSQFDHPETILEPYCDLATLSTMTASWNGVYYEGGYLGGCRLPNGVVL